MSSQIVTDYSPKPIPARQFDWTATLGEYDLGDCIGYGETKAEALTNLVDRLRERGRAVAVYPRKKLVVVDGYKRYTIK